MSAKRVDLTGQKFGRLTVVEFHGTPKKPNAWLCLCDCGVAKVVNTNAFKYGHTVSCGCWSREQVSQRFRKYTKESAYTHSSWRSMIGRCVNKVPTDSRAYKNYQTRDIRVCKRWLKFENFLADMGLRPQGKTIERKNNAGNYSPRNCVWATPKEQAQNRRLPSDTVFITYKGKLRTLKELAEISGFRVGTLRQRINCGWNVERAVEVPLTKRGWDKRR